MLNDLVTAVLVAVAAVIVSGLCERIAPLDADRPEISRLVAAVLAHKGVI
jgi:hypothetical protein